MRADCLFLFGAALLGFVGPCVGARALADRPSPANIAGLFQSVDSQSALPLRVTMMERLWPVAKDASDAEVRSAQLQADALAGAVSSCAEFEAAQSGRFRNLGWVELSDMPFEIQAIAINQPVGLPSAAIRNDEGFHSFIVCSRPH